jgi:hypothetical protein
MHYVYYDIQPNEAQATEYSLWFALESSRDIVEL